MSVPIPTGLPTTPPPPPVEEPPRPGWSGVRDLGNHLTHHGHDREADPR